MEEQGLTQASLANILNIERSNISEFLSGKHTPSYEVFIGLLYQFNCSADYLLGCQELHTEEILHTVPPFSERLRYVLDFRGISQSKLIKEYHVPPASLYKWVSGKSQPSTDTLIKLANILECSVDFLIGRVR